MNASGPELYFEKKLNGKKTVPKDILPLLETLKKRKQFSVRTAGKSVEGKPIFSVTFGSGKKRVLAWTQMHGNEPTATRAFFDFVNFISDEKNARIKETIFNALTVKVLVMLNPDGAEKNTRENALGIDINRDALAAISPESKILWKEFERFKPGYALNLHDQDCGYTAGATGKPVWLSFLATVAGKTKKITPARKKAIAVISETVLRLKKSGIKNIARYDDDYEPRAFGDNFAARKCSVILIEAGCAEKNPEKSFERFLFFNAFLETLISIAEAKRDEKYLSVYNSLPQNKERMLDTIITGVKLKGKYSVSAGIKDGRIVEVGDLSVYGAYEYIDAKGLIAEGKIFPGKTANFTLKNKKGEIKIAIKNGKITESRWEK